MSSDSFKNLSDLAKSLRVADEQLDRGVAPLREALAASRLPIKALDEQLANSTLARAFDAARLLEPPAWLQRFEHLTERLPVKALDEQLANSTLARAFDAARLLEPPAWLQRFEHLEAPSWFHRFEQVSQRMAGVMPEIAATLGSDTLMQLRSDLKAWEDLAAARDRHSTGGHVLGWQAAVVSGLTLGNMTGASPSLGPRLLAPATMLAAFARQTARRIERAASEQDRRRLEASVEVVEGQVASQLTDLEFHLRDAFVADADEEDDYAPDRRRIVLARREQHEILVAPSSTPTEGPALAATSPGVAAHTLVRRVLDLALWINRARNVAGHEDVFKLTNRLVQVSIDLPWIDVRDERSLGDFVDGLYFLLYEGAGKDRLRFLRAHGGPLEQRDCDVVFLVKHLRNKWLRHDPEHGDGASIRKSHKQLGDRLRELGLENLPYRAADYRALQRRLLEKVFGFLERLRDAFDLT